MNSETSNTESTALTIPENRLAGSAKCMNCGTELKGPFCYYCGQPDKNFMRFFPVLLRELLEDTLDFDSRFTRTLKPLLFRPGKLTRDYLDGKRFRYVPPLRLYIFSSIAFFFLAAILAGDAINITSDLDGDEEVVTGIHIGEEEEKEIHEALQGLEDLSPELAAELEKDIKEATQDTESDDSFNFNGEPWDRETNPVDIKWLPAWLNDRINDEIEESPHKAEQIQENPNLLVDKVFDILPATMFVLLPVVALIFKFWYLFAKRYYIEHLIFSLHNHAFVFVSLILILLANVSETLFTRYDHTTAATSMVWVMAVIGSWIPLYMLISLRVVYRQNWFMTMGKFTLIGLSYLTLLGLVTTGVAIASFVLL